MILCGDNSSVGSAMISSTSISSIAAAQPKREVLQVIYTADLGSPTFDRLRGERRPFTNAEALQILDETKDIMKAMTGFMKEGVEDPLAAAREAVAKTRAQQFDSRQDALSGAVRSFDWLIRASGAISGSQSSVASAESVRGGAGPDQLAVIDHVVARENRYQGMVNGQANVRVAMLERDFTVRGDIIKRDATGAMRLGAFELSHETYGRLLSVDDEGNVTIYDQNGGKADATAYVNALFGSDSVFSVASNRPQSGLIDRRL